MRGLKGGGLDGVKLVISDAHTGLKVAIARVFEATWQRCRVPWIRNALAHVPKGQHTVVAAAIRQAFTQPDRDSAGQNESSSAIGPRTMANAPRRRPDPRPLAKARRTHGVSHWSAIGPSDNGEREADVLAYMSFPSQHRTKLHSTNPLERLNKEVKRQADVVGIFPNEEVIIRLIGAVLFEQNDEWLGQHRYMQVEAFAQICTTERDPLLSIATQAA